MSFNNKRQSISSIPNTKTWILNKSRVPTKPFARPGNKSPYQKTITKSFSKSLNQAKSQKHTSFAYPHSSGTFLTSQQLPQSLSALHQITQSPEQPQNIDIDVLQTKIDKLLKQKLRILIQFNKHKVISKTKDIPVNLITIQSLIKINKQLQTLISQIKTNIEGYQNPKNIQKWKFLDKKIKMLEKVIAENYSEVEVMKKFYSKVSQSGTAYRNFCKEKQDSRINNIKDKHLKFVKEKTSNSLSPTSRLPFISQTKVQFKTPSSGYSRLNKSMASYQVTNLDNNPQQSIIQTSAYKRSYLRYPNLDDVQITQRHHSLPFNPFTKTTETSYKNDYIQPYQSKQQSINYKKLDCYKNKIKSMNLNYSMNIQRDKMSDKSLNEEYYRMNHSINKGKAKESVKTTPGIMTAVNPFIVTPQGDEKLYRARPKNNRLQALKSSFRCFITNQ